MGQKETRLELEGAELRVFTQALLRDVRALEALLAGDMIERGVRRIGLEQELFLVDEEWRPAPIALELLERLDDPRVTTEIGRFNLECNLRPLIFGGNCLSTIETRLHGILAAIDAQARDLGARAVLTGILPTLRKSDLTLQNMIPAERYYALNEALTRLRGGPYTMQIKGTDELRVTHDSVMLEAANASFQVHFQTSPEEFPRLYNIALAVSAPVLAAAVNSPLMLGRRLWHETRIAVFQQSIDTRQSIADMRDMEPRVSFGFVHPFPAETDPGLHIPHVRDRLPGIDGLLKDGVAHLRIENRVLPAGPTVLDEVANAAFWFGLVSALANEVDDVRSEIGFDAVRTNFVAAARHGIDAQLEWFGGRTWTAEELILSQLIPASERGLRAGGIDEDDISRYLETIRQRVESRQTGAAWMLGSLTGMHEQGSPEERMAALVAATVSRQTEQIPVAEWRRASLTEAGGWKPSYLRVEQYMSTDLLTVREDEPIDLVANLMDWHRIHHVPVEDNEHRLIGLVSHRPLLRFLAGDEAGRDDGPIPVSRVMARDLVTVNPETTTLEAIDVMRKHRISCLPVVQDERLIGIVTEHDFMRIAGQLLEEMLRE
ncbi:MAG: glutamate-cysteine ligase family protein [Gemmatimonadota bacterium]